MACYSPSGQRNTVCKSPNAIESRIVYKKGNVILQLVLAVGSTN